jgi:hypothetical protein
VTRACLEQQTRDAEACKPLIVLSPNEDETAQTLIEIAGEIADTAPGENATVRLLLRLEARGAWRASMAIERVLERRMLEHLGACAPPGAEELEATRALLAGVLVRLPAGGGRAPTPAELSDLAYLHASLRLAGPEVGASAEDETAPALSSASELERRAAMRAAMRAALVDGDVARHAEASEAYLAALGFPGPMRVAEDGDGRWGGAGFSYALRDWARSAEILGRYGVAASLRRRAAPGGGMCGTSTNSVRNGQIEGVIRAEEQRDGCRAVVAERLFAVSLDLAHAYGPERLAQAGFDVARLYRAALLDVGSEVDWAARLRAIAGYADVAGRDAIPVILALAEAGPSAQRIEALEVLGRLVANHGIDPCRPASFGFGRGSSHGERQVSSIMTRCETKLDDRSLSALVGRIAKLATDADPGVRESVAHALGRTASPRARAALEKLSRDSFDVGGRVCTSTTSGTTSGPQVCEPNRPVKFAAKEGLEQLAKAQEARQRQAQKRPR